MNIAIIVDNFPSLSETFISNKVEKLAARGHKLTVFCDKKNDQLFNELFSFKTNIKIARLNKQRVLVYVLLHPLILFRVLKNRNRIKRNIFSAFKIHCINTSHPDIIHFEFSGIGINYLDEIKFLEGIKVVSCRGSAEKVKLLIYNDRKEKFSELLNVIDAVHCVSENIKQTILPYCKYPKEIFINYPSIDTAFFKRKKDNENIQAPVILSVGRLTFQKGYSTGLLAIQLLKNEGFSFKWIIVGSGPNYEEIMFQINELGVNECVELFGSKSRNEVKQLMEQSHIFLLPSVYEGVANVALEAMSMELPVVSTRSGGMEEVITHGKDGLLADVYDHNALAENMVSLLQNPGLRALLGKAARKKVTEKFDLTMQIDKFENVYYQLLNKYPVRAEIKIDKEPGELKTFHYNKSHKPEKHLRIGIVVPQFPSYTETFFINKILGLCERGHRVNVFCNIYNRDSLLHKTYGFKNYANLKIIKLDFNKFGDTFIDTIFFNPFIFFKSIRRDKKSFKNNLYYNLCAHFFNKHSCDVYHFGYSALALAYYSILEKLPGKIIVSCLGTAENIKPLTEYGRIEKLSRLFNKVDKIHCVSAKMAETVREYGAPEEKIFINHPGINIKFFTRKNQYVSHQHIKILSVGRLVFQKGFLIGIFAISELKKKFSNFTWTIIGEGPEMEQLLFYINSLGLKNHTQLAGKKTRNEIVQFYEENDILFLPSVSEGLANVALEAMSMQLPVVSSVSGGIEEAIINQSNGVLCNNFDFIAMAQQLFDLSMNYEKRKKLGECARKTIERNFGIERYIDGYEKEYYSAIQV